MQRKEIDEHLETLWHLFENKESDIEHFRSHTEGGFDETIVRNLQDEGYITLEGDTIILTDKGFTQAEQIIRRHRLAEKLLALDILTLR